ncbi:MAG TPA: DUF3458 domain-containing protein [Allosphingosinicella sp.]|nr:DUF3458 domain-containing protein [Allosphingosinicella sp.]
MRRADRTPPPWLVPDIALDVDLDPACTRVRARLEARRGGAHQLPLRLDGEGLKLLSLRLDGKPAAHRVDPRGLTLRIPGDAATVETLVEIEPAQDPARSGLFESAGLLATHCEPEGFRRITYFPDRPDVLSRYRVRMTADAARFPILLSNGNRIAAGAGEGGRHWAEWEDPWPKPCYLFALLAGTLEARRGRFVTRSGRDVALAIWARAADLPFTAHMIETLRDALAWDERAFGRDYDLDMLNVGIVPGFGFGAMENKGLLLFDQAPLVDPEAATDAEGDIAALLVAHEFLHNWSGNRVTLRDWFELGWKEGLTVFRDQSFAASRGSAAAKRIEDVLVLRGGPLAGDRRVALPPVRPDAYDAPGDLFAASTYTVAAEIVRMVETMAGAEPFRRDVAAFFDRHDGQAVGWEDFLAAAAPPGTAEAFLRWCEASGLPAVRATLEKEGGRLRLIVTQDMPGGPRPIPLRIALFDRESGAKIEERLISAEAETQAFDLGPAGTAPVLSINRGFSAPIALAFERASDDLAWLATHDDDPFARWDAMQALMAKAALGEAETALVAEALAAGLDGPRDDPAFLALLAAPPHETILADGPHPLDPRPILSGLARLRREIGAALAGRWRAIQAAPAPGKGERALRNLALDYLVAAGTPDAGALALAQLNDGPTMTEQDGALRALAHSDLPERATGLAGFHARRRDKPAALDKWFAAQALSRRPNAIEEARRLLAHPDFTLSRPTRIGALLGGVGANFGALHHPSGLGYRFLADAALALDRHSPQAAARIAAPLLNAPPLEPRRAALLAAQLQRLRAAPNLSLVLERIAIAQ